MSTDIILAISLVAILGLQYLAGRTGKPAVIAILPILALITFGVLVAKGTMNSWHDWLMAVVTLAILFVFAGHGLDARAKRLKAEDDKISNSAL